MRSPDGYIILTGDGPTVERDSVMCCHCGKHYAVQPGSGKKRGFCMKCMLPTCGSRKCDDCKPLEKMLEEIERKATIESRYQLR